MIRGAGASTNLYNGTPIRLGAIDFGNGFSGIVGNTYSNTTVDNLTSVSRIYPGMAISGTAIPSGTIVSSVNSTTQVTISQNATATNTGTNFSFNALQSSTMPGGSMVKIYVVPASTYIQVAKLTVVNRNSSTAALIQISHNGTAAVNCLASNTTLLSNETKEFIMSGLQPNDYVSVLSDTANVSFVLSGFSTTIPINQKKLNAMNIDGATNLVNTNYVLHSIFAGNSSSVSLLVCNTNTTLSATIRVAVINGNAVSVGSSITEGSNSFYPSDYIIYDDVILPNSTKCYSNAGILIGFTDMFESQSMVVRSSTTGTVFQIWREQ